MTNLTHLHKTQKRKNIFTVISIKLSPYLNLFVYNLTMIKIKLNNYYTYYKSRHNHFQIYYYINLIIIKSDIY